MTDTPSENRIYKAVCDVMNEVHGLKKDEKNNHGGYNYVSVDSFKALIRPLMAKHGLSLLMTERDFELIPLPNSRSGETMHAKIRYAFELRHVSGASEEQELVTIVLPLTGAQTMGAAKSYCLKEYLKGRFLVATGDKDLIQGGADADAFAQQDLSTPSGKSAYRARKDGTDKEYQRIEAGLNKIEAEGSMEDLALFWRANQEKIADMPVGWKAELTEKKDALKEAFEKGAAKPLTGAEEAEHDTETGEIVDSTEAYRNATKGQ